MRYSLRLIYRIDLKCVEFIEFSQSFTEKLLFFSCIRRTVTKLIDAIIPSISINVLFFVFWWQLFNGNCGQFVVKFEMFSRQTESKLHRQHFELYLNGIIRIYNVFQHFHITNEQFIIVCISCRFFLCDNGDMKKSTAKSMLIWNATKCWTNS